MRVYGIIINEENEILLSDESQLEMGMHKFPQSEMNFDEGTLV